MRSGKGIPVVGRKDQLPVEALEETEGRLAPGSVKHGIFQVSCPGLPALDTTLCKLPWCSA